MISALKRYTAYAHPAGSGFDYASAINLKNEWEEALGLPISGPEGNIYEAGSSESQLRVLGGMTKAGVWIDTVSPSPLPLPLPLPPSLNQHVG